jgi:hypothetical protein
MNSKEVILQMIQQFGPKLFELNGSLTLWMNILETMNMQTINTLVDKIVDMDCHERYQFAKRILNGGMDSAMDQLNANNSQESDEETAIEDTVYEDTDQTRSMSSEKSYQSALDSQDDQSTDGLADDDHNTTDTDFSSNGSQQSDVSRESSDGLSGRILSLSTITSIGSQRSALQSPLTDSSFSAVPYTP